MQKIILSVLVCLLLAVSVFAQEQSDDDIQLTDSEKIYWLSFLWSEAKYNFAYFDQVPDLDWDAAFIEYTAKILSTESTLEFYRVIQQFLALLNDGHSSAWLARSLRNEFDRPPLLLEDVEGKPVVVEVEKSLAESIPLGTEIVAVDGEEVLSYMRTNIFPLIGASTEHARLSYAIKGSSSSGFGLLQRPQGTQIRTMIKRPDGSTEEILLTCNSRAFEDPQWVRATERYENCKLRWLDDEIVFMAIIGFPSGDEFGKIFETLKPELMKARGIILDFRKNYGGYTFTGLRMLSHFTDRNFDGLIVRSREHKSSLYAYGRTGNGRHAETYGKMNGWFDQSTLSVESAGKDILKMPVIILIDYPTVSAAEDVLVFARELDNVTLVGRTTNGSSGTPAFYTLPGGGMARVCTERHTLMDGTEFIGKGIVPDVFSAPSIQSIAEQRDAMLEKGLEVLKEILNSSYKYQ